MTRTMSGMMQATPQTGTPNKMRRGNPSLLTYSFEAMGLYKFVSLIYIEGINTCKKHLKCLSACGRGFSGRNLLQCSVGCGCRG